MKQHIFPALRLTAICLVVFVGLYTTLIWAVAQALPTKGKGETVTVNSKIVGYALEGQNFTADNYFNGRPSACGYNAAGSGGSNKGPSNPDYLQTVKDRMDTFLVHNPSIKKEQIPAELLTASGSGLDPDISPIAALVQVKRIAHIRKVPEANLQQLIEQNTEKPLLGLMGTLRVNVLKLNIELDKLTAIN